MLFPSYRCGQDELEVVEVNRENMCVILIDNGVVDDHLPNHVLSSLKSCKTCFMDSPRTYDRDAIREMREQREHLLSGIRRLKLAHENSAEANPDKRFFVGGSPMGDPPGQIGKKVKRYQLHKQGSFDGVPMSSLTSSITADGQGLEVPHHRTAALSRISECTEDDARSVETDIDLTNAHENGKGTVTVTADVTEVTRGSEFAEGAKATACVALDMDEKLLECVDGSGSETGFNSKTKQGTSAGSNVVSQSSDASLPLGHSIDSPISSLPLTPASVATDDVFSPGGGVGGSLKSREGLSLGLRSDGGSTDSLTSVGSNKLLARRNVTIEKLKLTPAKN